MESLESANTPFNGFKLPVIVAVTGIFLIIIYFFIDFIYLRLRTVGNGGPTFMIVGPSGAGKTALFSMLQYGERVSTLPSIEQNVSTTFKLTSVSDQKNFVLIDTPGHQKLRHSMFATLQANQVARSILGVIYMVDASVVSKPEKLREAADYLYDLLRIAERVRLGTDVLIAANKSELFTAVPAKRLRSLLENEITKIRVLRSKSVGSVTSGDEKTVDEEEESDSIIGGRAWLGAPDSKEFHFEDLESDVVVIDGSVEKGSIDSWIRWMEERVVS
ncbi:signal recognition particle receptor beta subunit-domain-containing protein [Dipodascopsis uninucleata]